MMAEKKAKTEKKEKKEKVDEKVEEKQIVSEKPGKKETKKEEKKETKKKEKKLPEEIHTINLKEAYEKPRTRRAKAAINAIRDYVFKHKRKEAVISPALNAVIWERGIEKPPRKIRVKLVIGEDKVTVYPVE